MRLVRKLRSLFGSILRGRIARSVLRVCVRWPWFADLFYCFSSAFRREHRAVLWGRLKHLEQLSSGREAGACYGLRRNIHRLEKGLISRPRREVFAREYIQETVGLYCSLFGNSSSLVLAPLESWSRDVLTNYFDAVESDSVVDKERIRFEQQRNRHRSEPAHAPYRRDLSPLQIKYDGMLELANRRRSVRWYMPKPVPREIIDGAIEVAKLSPSACNRQPFEFRIFDQPDLAVEIGSIPMGTTGFADNFPCVVVLVGDLSAYAYERDRHVIYVDGGLAAMAFQFGLEVQGVSSCCINWPGIEHQERKMEKALNLGKHQRPLMLISLGYPDPKGMVPYSQKKSLDEIRSYNRR